jgi:aminodeoxyfutalosine deaminase
MESIRIQADAVIVSPERILRPGQIVVRRGKIVECSQRTTETADIVLTEQMLSPCLINPHTHLEFSDLKTPFSPGDSFPQWIRAVVQHRRKMAQSQSPEAFEQWRSQCIQAGLTESHRAGVALIADIVTPPWLPPYTVSQAFEPLRTAPPECIINRSGLTMHDLALHLIGTPQLIALAEILGLEDARFDESKTWAMHLLNQTTEGTLWQYGLSPHSPYSLTFSKLQQALNTEQTKQSLTAMHVAESLEEREWLAAGSGPFRIAFEQLGVPATTPRPSIDQIIEWLASRKRSLLIHGNYLHDEEIVRVSQARGMSVVYCPRTHQHFGHSNYPIKRLLSAGVHVVIGTDSRASNPDLNPWGEVNAVRSAHPWLAPAWSFAAVTQAAADALGAGHILGSLEVGKLAAINVSSHQSALSNAELLDDLTTRINPFRPLADCLGECHNSANTD